MTTTTDLAPNAQVGFFEWASALREAEGISLASRGVWLTLASYADTRTGTEIRPSLSRLAVRLGVSRSSLTKHLATGVGGGWFLRTEDNASRGKPSVYRLAIPRGCPPDSAAGDREVPQGCPPDSAGVPATFRRGDREVPQGVPARFRTISSGISSVTASETSSGISSEDDGYWEDHEEEATMTPTEDYMPSWRRSHG